MKTHILCLGVGITQAEDMGFHKQLLLFHRLFEVVDRRWKRSNCL